MEIKNVGEYKFGTAFKSLVRYLLKKISLLRFTYKFKRLYTCYKNKIIFFYSWNKPNSYVGISIRKTTKI